MDCSAPSDEDHLLDQDSDLRDDEDLHFMDFDEQMKIYDNMENQKEELINKFKIQGLEEVTEMTEESDMSDVNSCDDTSSISSDCSNSETVDRVQMAEDMKEYQKIAL